MNDGLGLRDRRWPRAQRESRSSPGLRFIIHHSSFIIARSALVLFFLGVAALAPLLAPADPLAINSARALQGPGPTNPFGTDRFGRDVLSRAMYGARVSLLVGVGSIALAA